ncbi:MAG: alpha-amylase family glycosyl hydrolase [Actinomycetota bacterium]|nr:alpha-amylase family glycosyl hydrolase [Actinomycetota bacterium]
MQALAQPSPSNDLTPEPTTPDWWRGAVGYEVYIRSFADADGDGVGDLAGVMAKLPYLASLGLDVVWITPFFRSPGFDHGYDVADYCDVDPLHGTLADWDALAVRAKELGLKLFVDVVPNHSSSHHRWFQQAVADPTGPYRDYYVWADPAADGGPPNNWLSHFGGPAWSLDPGGSGQYYCHLFLPEQPDLNWANPKLMEEFAAILRFWSDRGADGFRIDVAHGLTKDPALRDNPVLRPVLPGMHPQEAFQSFQHIHDLHRHETAVLFRQWRAAVEGTGVILLGEMDTRDVPRFAEFVADGTALHAGFVLQVGLGEWDPAHIIATMLNYQVTAKGGCAWEVSNHDQARAVSRYGGGDKGLGRALALTALMAVFDGMVFVYQGEELGLPDAVLVGPVEDPMSSRSGEGMWSRDVSRGPMPWTDGPVNGFTTGPAAWLATMPVPTSLTAEHQVATPGSTWHRYRELIGLRKRFPALWQEPFELVEQGREHIVLRRGSLLVVANLGAQPVAVAALAGLPVVYTSGDQPVGAFVPAECTLIVDTSAREPAST